MAEHISFGVDVTVDGDLVTGVLSVEPPEVARDFTDTTNHNSPNRWVQQRPTLIRASDMTIDIQQDATNMALIGDIKFLDSPVECTITFADSLTYVMSVYYKSYKPDAQGMDGVITGKLVLAVTGGVVMYGDIT